MPLGISDFEKIRTNGYYYIDKTDLISQITTNRAEVTLFTRSRRFGKSLNMSMLQHFFDITENSKAIFDGLKISENQTLCDEWRNQYPTILISFKTVDSINFENAVAQLKLVLSDLFAKYTYLLNNKAIDENDIKKFMRIQSETPQISDIMDSLFFLTRLLNDYYKKKVILLIDEYDVPMAKGDANGYYREITDIMRSMFSKSLKDNTYIRTCLVSI